MWKTLKSLLAELLPGWVKMRALRRKPAPETRRPPED